MTCLYSLYLFHYGVSPFNICKLVDKGRTWLKTHIKVLVVPVVDSKTGHKAVNHQVLCCDKASRS